MGEQHANDSRVSRYRLVADATTGVIANPTGALSRDSHRVIRELGNDMLDVTRRPDL